MDTHIPNLMRLRWITLASLLAFFPLSVFADVSEVGPKSYVPQPIPTGAVWVAPFGSDQSGNGSQARPFYTPARASEVGHTVVLLPGRYTQFGTILRGGTATDPLVIRAASGTVVFALQDGNVPADIRASHVRLEGIEIHNEELAQPGTCLRFGADVTDVEILNSKIHHCARAIVTDGHTWSHGTLRDVTLSDIGEIGIDCSGACTHQRWNRVLLQHIGSETTSGTALSVSDRSHDLRLRDLIVRDVIGDGARFYGSKPSIANSLFNQISGTALLLKRGGYLGHVQIDTETTGLVANVGDNLVIERSLFHAQRPTASPFAIAADDQSKKEATLLLSWNRIDVPNAILRLGGIQSQHQIIWSGMVFWFRDETDLIQLPGGNRIRADQALRSPAITKEEESLVYPNAPIKGDLFSALFSGGTTIRNNDGSRTISAGSQIRGNEQEPPYVLGQQQRVHLLTGDAQIARWYPYPREITTIGDGPFGSLLRGGDVTEPPGTLIKARSRPHVYLVTAPNFLRWISSEALAEMYAGPRWNTHIIEFSDDVLTHYQEDLPILHEQDFEDSDILRQLPDPADLFEK